MRTVPRPIIAGNWKMNQTPTEARRFFADFLKRSAAPAPGTVLIFPAAISFAAAAEAVEDRPDVRLGIQNVYWEPSGAFTGETSVGMARDAGAEFVLVGHSERRHVFGESAAEAARKVRAVLDAGLFPVLCVGETLDERRAAAADKVVRGQLAPVLEQTEPTEADRLIVAYEPVWAIGTGETASSEDAAAMHRTVRNEIAERWGHDVAKRIPILYGGSVKPDNAAELLARPEIDGVLVGGASLKPADFAAICKAAA